MSKLTIVTGADSEILRIKTQNVPKVTKEILKLVKDMQETVEGVNGGGLAAPQVGQSLRVCLALINEKMTTLINPEITWHSKETTMETEGCLSIPDVWLPVTRSTEIAIKYLDDKGEQQERRLRDWDARVVQHEIDHLDGILIVDRADTSVTLSKMEQPA